MQPGCHRVRRFAHQAAEKSLLGSKYRPAGGRQRIGAKGRQPIARLAKDLGVSRGQLYSRLSRLEEIGVVAGVHRPPECRLCS